MNLTEIPMWNQSRKLPLSWVLSNVVCKENLEWVLRQFSGVGGFLFGSSMDEFERGLESSKFGYKLSFQELTSFSDGIEDLIDIELIGWNGTRPVVKIVGEDSTRWLISYEDDWFRQAP